MRSVYIVTYDICDDKRLRAVYKTMRGVGDHIQYSVFRCELSKREVAELIASLEEKINNLEDQVLLIELGPGQGRANEAIQAVGRSYSPLLRRAKII